MLNVSLVHYFESEAETAREREREREREDGENIE
jgi:hypothetical protein